MPRIPDAVSLGQRPQFSPTSGVAPIDTSSLGNAERHLGDVAMAAADEFQKHVEIETERANRLRAEDALNKLSTAEQDLTLGENGFSKMEGANAVTRPLVQEYGQKFSDQRQQIASTLSNPRQQQLFNERADVIDRQFKGKALTWVAKQSDVYEKQVVSGAEDNAIATAANNPGSDAEFETSLVRAEFLRRARGEREGEAPEFTDGAIAGIRDKAWVARYQALVQNSPRDAVAMFQKSSGEMSAATRLHVFNVLNESAAPIIAAQQAATNAPIVQKLAPQPGVPLPTSTQVSPAVEKFGTVIDSSAAQYGVDPGVMRRQLQVESGGNPNAMNMGDIAKTGSPSIGIAQFQPPTAQRYGIDPKDPKQAIQGQAAYLSDLLKQFDGDYRKAVAAYNMGEGNTRLQNGVTGLVMKYGDAWFDHLKPSTRDYVNKIVGSDQRQDPQARLSVLNDALAGATTDAQTAGIQSQIDQVRQQQASAPANRTADYASMTPSELLSVKTGDPVIDAMPPSMKLRTMGLMQTEAIRQRQQKQALLGTREADANASYLVNGSAQNAPTTAEFVDAYGPIEGMKRARRLDEARQTGQTIQQMSTLPTSQIQQIAQQRPQPGEGFAEAEKNYELKVAAAQRIVSARQTDPVAYAIATKSYGIQPMTEQTLTDPTQLASGLRSRAGAAQVMAKDYGTVPALLTKGESQAISTVLKQAPAPQQKQFLAAIYQGTGDMNTYKGMLQQLAPDAPTIALAGLYQARGNQSENPTLGRRDVADLILRGHAILNPPKKEDGGEHIGGKALVKMPTDDLMRSDFNAYVGDAFKDKEKAKDVLWQAAREIYAARSSEEGDDNGNLNGDRWKSAMQLASGGIEKHNGANIVMPYGTTLDSFRDQVGRRVQLLAPQGVKVTADELSSLPLENSGDGKYVFRRGTGYVVDQQGRPLQMDFNVPIGQVAPQPTTPRGPVVPTAKLNQQPFAVGRSGAVTGRGR